MSTPATSSNPPPSARPSSAGKGQFEVDLPAGGRLTLQNQQEVDMWEATMGRYIQDYSITKANDLVLLGAILSQGVAMFRAQQDLADPKKNTAAIGLIAKASEQISALEKTLGIDKKSREAGGQHTVDDYITRLKRAALEKGVHIADMVKAYEALAMELRWRIRLLDNGDDEDQSVHGISETAIITFARDELEKLEQKDKEWSTQKGRVFVGTL